MPQEISLVEAVELLRSNIGEMVARRERSGINFEIENAEIELSITFGSKAAGGLEVKVLGFLGVSTKVDTTMDATHKIKLTLRPMLDGAPVLAASGLSRKD